MRRSGRMLRHEGDLDEHDRCHPAVATLEDALEKLATESPRLVRLVELRFFAGLSIEEAAAAMDLSPATIKRDWSFARAWLLERLES